MNSLENDSTQEPSNSRTNFPHICGRAGHETDGFEPWGSVLHDAGPKDHIVQLYQDEQFLNRAVCRFAAAALAHGEGVILVPTAAHWEAFCPRLEAEGVDIRAAQAQGQLTVVDADELLPRFMGEKMPDAPVFLGLAGEVVARARGRNRYPKVRWWGEMVNVLWERGNATASMALEDLFDQLAHEQEIAIFCSFLMDNFDGEVHTRMLPRLGENHSHLIPVEDYLRLERAVAEAPSRRWSGPSRRVSSETSCLRATRRRSTCHPPRHCCSRCARWSPMLPTRCSNEAVRCIALPDEPASLATPVRG